MSKMLSTTEVSEMLNINKTSIPRLIKMGLKRHLRGKRYYFKQHEVLNFKKSILDVYTAIGGNFKKGRPKEFFSSNELSLNTYYTGKYARDQNIKKQIKDGIVKFSWKQIV